MAPVVEELMARTVHAQAITPANRKKYERLGGARMQNLALRGRRVADNSNTRFENLPPASLFSSGRRGSQRFGRAFPFRVSLRVPMYLDTVPKPA